MQERLSTVQEVLLSAVWTFAAFRCTEILETDLVLSPVSNSVCTADGIELTDGADK